MPTSHRRGWPRRWRAFRRRRRRCARLALADPAFREICEEYALAQESLARFEARPDAAERPEIGDYRTVIAELEGEIDRISEGGRAEGLTTRAEGRDKQNWRGLAAWEGRRRKARPPNQGKPMKKFPTAFTILFGLIVVVAALTWIIPAGQYERAMNETLGQEAPVPGTYAQVEPNPQGLVAVLMAPIAGLYDPATGMANAVDVAVFVLIIGGFLAVVTKTGAIDAGIGWLLTALKGREIWMIPILMAAFAAGGTSYGMAEESLAFYAIVLPVFIRAGYDALTGVAVIMLGCGIGTLGSTFNAFATVIASNAAGVPFTDGLLLRVFILFACLAAGILFVMRYAQRVKAEPARSVVAAQREDNIAHFLKGSEVGAPLPEFNRVREIILALFGLTFVMMLYGVIARGWWMGQMSALFLGMAIVTFFVAKFDASTKMDEHTFVDTFVNGARDLLGVALIIGVARGIVVIMDAGKITDTILNALAGDAGRVRQRRSSST